jgi:hypothetical protein
MKKLVKEKVKSASKIVRSDHPLVGTWEETEKSLQMSVRYNHPLVGTWQEVENSVSETSVVYKITAADGHFVVSGIDEGDGTQFKISSVRWDGATLQFTSLFPPTGHRAKHVLRALKPGLVNHWVTSTALEVWRKRPRMRRQRRLTPPLPKK